MSYEKRGRIAGAIAGSHSDNSIEWYNRSIEWYKHAL
jgi:hypothetical protein